MRSYSCSSSDSKSQQIASLSSLLKLVSEESRLKILCILRNGEHCVCELMDNLGMSQSLISHHLKDLKDAGIVIDEKRGLKVFYWLTEKGKHITTVLFQISNKEDIL